MSLVVISRGVESNGSTLIKNARLLTLIENNYRVGVVGRVFQLLGGFIVLILQELEPSVSPRLRVLRTGSKSPSRTGAGAIQSILTSFLRNAPCHGHPETLSQPEGTSGAMYWHSSGQPLTTVIASSVLVALIMRHLTRFRAGQIHKRYRVMKKFSSHSFAALRRR